MVNALSYLRTSSAANVDGDSSPRQRAAIASYAAANGIELVGEYYDAAVSGSVALEARPGFIQMLARIEGNGVRLVLVEEPGRFARHVVVQELGVRWMQSLGVRVVTAGGVDLTDDTDTDRTMMRQLLGAIAAAEKTRLVRKLRGARDRNAAARGYRTDRRPAGAGPYEAVYAAIRRLIDDDPAMSLQALADALTAQGLTAMVGKKDDKRPGKPFATSHISRFIKAMDLKRVDGRSKAARAA
jgi:DNA invertase Pin-like site-specific DNA recombinase